MSIEAMKDALIALFFARGSIEDWGGYASDYFQNKHDLKGDISKVDKAIASLRQQIALEEKAENARELGLDYEPVPWIENMTIDSTNELSKPITPVQKPVAWWVNSGHEGDVLFDEAEACRYALTINGSVTPLYTALLNPMDSIKSSKTLDAQPQREWVGLTEEDFVCINQTCRTPIEAAEYALFLLKEKNT